MKILLIGGTAPNSGDAPLLLQRALEAEGCQVYFIAIDAKQSWWGNVLMSAGAHGSRALISHAVSYLNHEILKQVRVWKPDIVFYYGSNIFTPPPMIGTLQDKYGCRVILWEVNNRCFGGIQAGCIPLYDHIFALDSYLTPVLHLMGARRVTHLCACMDPQEHFPIKLTPTDLKRFGSDVCLIGTAYLTRTEILRNLTEYDLKIYGNGWKRDPMLSRLHSDEPIMDVTKLKIFSAARVSLNIHGPQMINGENFRVFEVAACEGVSFSLPKPDLLQCFEPDSEIIIFTDVDDLRQKLDYYLAHPHQLKEIGRAARERALAEHTYSHRAKTILHHLTISTKEQYHELTN